MIISSKLSVFWRCWWWNLIVFWRF